MTAWHEGPWNFPATFIVPADWHQVFLYLRVVAEQACQPTGGLAGQAEVVASEITILFAQREYEMDGEPVSAQEVSALLTSPDRHQRQAASLSSWRSLRRIAPQVVSRYRAGLNLRRELAERSGEPSVHRHMWRLLERFDYTPEQVRSSARTFASASIPSW